MTTVAPNPPHPHLSSNERSIILSASNVYKTYRMGRVDVPVLRGASLQVGDGEWVAILGASGSGKSTMMHILGGLDRPDVRSDQPCVVAFRGTKLTGMSSTELDDFRNISVGFVFQFYHLLPELNVIENTLLPAMRRYGKLGFLSRRKELTAHAEELLTGFGLGHRLRHRPTELSGGERQRTAIARALVNNPPVLLADEPTGNLDHKTGEAILDAIANVRSSGMQTKRTIVMVTHDKTVAARADRIVHLNDGLVVSG